MNLAQSHPIKVTHFPFPCGMLHSIIVRGCGTLTAVKQNLILMFSNQLNKQVCGVW